MSWFAPSRRLGLAEFVSLTALLMALAALAIDAILPALPELGAALGAQGANDPQLVVSVLVLGLGVGQLFAGPMSDAFGRRPIVGVGLAVFAAGCLVSIVAPSLFVMLAGRFLQGVGLAGPRVVCVALVRDLYVGDDMARVMSFVMAVFILVPMVAPSLGQGVLLVAGWQWIFGLFLVLSVGAGIWFAARQPETLAMTDRRPISITNLVSATLEVLRTRMAIGYTLTAGLVSGAFIGYLSTAQQIFQVQYGLGRKFPLVFAALAASIGLAAAINGRLVQRFGMRAMIRGALVAMVALSSACVAAALIFDGHPPFWLYMTYLGLNLFAIGVMFGNVNAVAMEPLGHIAGLGAAIVGALTTLISGVLGIGIGKAYDGTVVPLVAGFAVLSLLSLLTVAWTEA